MRAKIRQKGKVTEEGKLILFDNKLLPFRGKHILCTVELPYKPRSLDANSRHWARMEYAAEALGDRTKEELHRDFLGLFHTDRTVIPHRVKSSTELSSTEFSQWEADIDMVLARVEIIIPEPEREE